jgi:hypothetical protein
MQMMTMTAVVIIATISFMIFRLIAQKYQPVWGGTAAGVAQTVSIIILDMVCIDAQIHRCFCEDVVAP